MPNGDMISQQLEQEKKERERDLDKKRQQKRMEFVVRKFGKIVPIPMLEETKARLEIIAEKTVISRKEKNAAEKRSAVIAELVNQYYLDNILPCKHENSKLLYAVYNQIWQANFDGKPSDMIVRELTNAGIRIPYFDSQSGKIIVDSGQWKLDDVNKLSDTAAVIEMIESNEKKTKREQK
ncbi:hypothetical protein KVH62_001155 [Salmonella enterica]|uniref:hypothetical protein n=1 Tax=Salmonella enterica TaxID=28901 RepID=UPI00111857E9|nr:hypothetical protein [Salmonella enterica]EBF9651581.1 hypothetical protein [Salmonella enterica subsp. enterica serovar Idikan]EDT7270576.1 hypothetical protein [Salmonella enterica subsp. enterica serovar Bere]EHS0746663.1 hypothetical protein [Salmonella enterica]EHS0776295.1 hypothetical protein [Salmonella enterica]EHS0823793.1 hypothetical protein [Salmonella enterica]